MNADSTATPIASDPAETFEAAKLRQLEERRTELNQQEAALARAPVALLRLTRAQGEKLGIWF